jgi:deazaflavin-dependent oxidoreductase (nitroreductase family)
LGVELPPRGTRGAKWPVVPRPLVKPWAFLNVAFYRLFGRFLRPVGAPLMLLTTVGARTGRLRKTTLCCFSDPRGGWLIVASNYGAVSHPAWYFNLARNPDGVTVEMGGQRLRVRPESLRGTERDEAWTQIVAQSPSTALFGRRPTASHRCCA